MNKPLRVLHLEDEPDFAALVSAILEKEGLGAEIVAVTDFSNFKASLEKDSFDIIICDYLLPTCNGSQALEAARLSRPEIPFILLSGAIGEHAAIEILRGGATDYVLKSRLECLVPAIRRAVQEADEHSQLQRAEAEVRESERKYRMIFNGSPVPMWVSDLKTDAILEVNEAAIRHYGFSREEFLALRIQDISSDEELARLLKYRAEAATKRSEPSVGHAGAWQHRKKGGSPIHVEITWSLIVIKGEEALLTMANNVTESRQGAVALKKSEASLAAAQRLAHLGSWELDLANPDNLESNKLLWSDEAYRIFGFEPNQVDIDGKFFFNAVHSEDRPRIKNAMTQALRNKEPFFVENRILLPTGEERIVRQRAELILDDEKKPIQMRGIVMDITKRKRLEEQLRQSQKLDAIGQLAGGVAHDFNNILTVTHGHALLLLQEKTLPKSAKESAQQIAQAAERAAGLTRQLLAFSRRQVMQFRRLDLNQVVSTMTMMLERVLGEDIALQFQNSPQPAFVQADSSMLEQVLVNLAVNARDAMPKGGQLALEIGEVEFSRGRVAAHPDARAGQFVCLTVTDNGTGIKPDDLKHIFEPFFSTRELGNRTGLGLATVYGIIKQHQGWIEAESKLDSGATFRVYLPLNKAADASGEDKPVVELRGGKETILVVEDEANVRELACKILGGYGYKILPAESGAKALDIWRSSKDQIDLLMTDFVLPDQFNGQELAEKLRKISPQLKVIYSSGYSTDIIGKEFVSQQGQYFLQKPYDLQELVTTVRTCLDSTPKEKEVPKATAKEAPKAASRKTVKKATSKSS